MILLVILLLTQSYHNMPVKSYAFIYLLMLLITGLCLSRAHRCVLKIDDEELYFNDGMMNQIKVPLDKIEYVDYHPDLKFRVKVRKYKRKIAVANVFSMEDQEDILRTLKKKRHSIDIHRLERPKKIIVFSGKGAKEG